MSERFVWTERAIYDAERLDRPARDRVLAAVERFAATGDGDLKHLQGRRGEWRLRVGRWRIRLTIEGGTLHILRVLPRDQAYRD
jgi:mRNA-degrading endonuclease RelE of RelBE toxin-antitoxin system